MQREQIQKQWYKEYYGKTGLDRNDLRLNPGVLFQVLAAEKAFILAVRQLEHNPARIKVLDVGCGVGGDAYQLLRVGYLPENITGIDVQPDRLDSAKRLYPSMRLVHADATEMGFQDGEFELVFESTMFATLPDDEVSSKIAGEMLRVCKAGGYLLLVDWWTPKHGDPSYKALTKSRLAALFKLGDEARLIGVYHGALVPPVGRFLSTYFPALYFPLARLFPFLVGQVAYLLQKRPSGPHPSGAYYAAYSSDGVPFDVKLEEGMSFFWWRPGWLSIIPPALGFRVFVLWLMHRFGLFFNHEYSVLYVKHGDRIVHHSSAIPGYFRWPFMGREDLQISSTWTDPAYRGKNLATLALQKIVSDLRRPGRRFWYVSCEENFPSIVVAKKVGFSLHAYAMRTRKFGIQMFGQLLLVPLKHPAK